MCRATRAFSTGPTLLSSPQQSSADGRRVILGSEPVSARAWPRGIDLERSCRQFVQFIGVAGGAGPAGRLGAGETPRGAGITERPPGQLGPGNPSNPRGVPEVPLGPVQSRPRHLQRWADEDFTLDETQERIAQP